VARSCASSASFEVLAAILRVRFGGEPQPLANGRRRRSRGDRQVRRARGSASRSPAIHTRAAALRESGAIRRPALGAPPSTARRIVGVRRGAQSSAT
jgi:hypothetical protein